MPDKKSQLDVYRMDRSTILEGLEEVIDEEIFTDFQKISKKMDLHDDVQDDELILIAEAMVGYVITQQNRKAKGLKYKSIELNAPQFGAYRIMLYEAYSEPTSAVKNLVLEQIVGKTKKNSSVSYILFLCNKRNLYAFASGSGWQSITPYADSLFGLQILSRLIPARSSSINSVHYRGFTGTIAAQSTNFRQKARTTEILDFGQLCKDVSGQISVEKVKESLGIYSTAKRKNVGADFKSAFKLKKSMSLSEFCLLLDKITDLLEVDPYFSLEDWLGISPIGNTKKEKALKCELTNEVLKQLYSSITIGNEDKLDVLIVNGNIASYMSADIYRVTEGTYECNCDEFSSAEDLGGYVRFLIERNENNTDNTQQVVLEALARSTIESFSDGINGILLTTGKLIEHIQFDIVYKKINYLLLDGKWYVIYEGLNSRLNSELPLLIKNRISNLKLPAWKEINEDDYIDSLSNKHMHAKMHRLRPLDNIELCDTMIFDSNRLILCHIKDGFDTNMRVLAAQVQSSAELLNEIKLANRIDELKAKWLKLNAIKNLPRWDIVEDALSGKYEIVECIVMNPTVDITRDVSTIKSTIAKYELSRLIKTWTYTMSLEVVLPTS